MDADKLPKEIVYNDVYNTDVNYHGRAGLSSITYAYMHEAESKGLAMKMKWKVALVTGVDKGIGKTAVLVFTHEDTDIVVNGLY
ncbi:MAG: hypothetical protein ABSA18_00790 [Dehalococcoidia bacterium]|jgi:hypothetical protein